MLGQVHKKSTSFLLDLHFLHFSFSSPLHSQYSDISLFLVLDRMVHSRDLSTPTKKHKMKFGSHLKTHRTPHWKFNFVDYDSLKAHLKTYTDDREFTEQNEDQFIKLLRSELDKVYTPSLTPCLLSFVDKVYLQ